MNASVLNSRMLDAFPFLSAVPDAEWANGQPQLLAFPAGMPIFRREEGALYGMLLLSGTARITLIDEDGSESVMGRLAAGDICSLLVLSGLSGRDYPGSIVAESDVEALFVLKSSFLRWIGTYELMRKAVFGGLLDDLIAMGGQLQARRGAPLDARLAEALLRVTSEQQPLLHATHRELAAEIGSAREVVSRALRRYRSTGLIETGRGWVRIASRSGLAELLGDPVTED